MADFNSSLPVRTQTNGDVVAFLADGTTPSQLLAISSAGHISSNLFDGLGTAINSQAIGGSQWLQVVMPGSGPAAPGTASAYSLLAGGIYNSTPETLTNGQQSALQLNANGYLLVAATAASLGYDTNYGTVGTTTLRTAAQIGNATGAADFGAGATDAQTLRVSANQGTPATLANAWSTKITDGTNGPAAVKAASTAAVAADPALVVALSPNSPLPAGSAVIGAVTQSGGPWTQNLTQVGGSAITLGQKVSASSIPVVLASDQSAIPVSQSGTWTVQPGNTANTTPWLVTVATALPAGTNTIGSVNQGTSPWVVSGTVAVTQSTSPWVVTFDALGSATGGTAAAQSDLAGGIYNSTPPTLTNGQQASLQLDAAGNLDVNLQTPIPAGTNLIGGTTVYVGSSAASITNPLPVTVTSAVPGTPIQFYATSVALAAGASHTFTYTVAAGHTFSLERVWASGSGKIKAVVQNGASTIFVGFNSTASPNIDMTVVAPPTIAAAGTVNVVITNNDLLAFDVYVTIEGNQN